MRGDEPLSAALPALAELVGVAGDEPLSAVLPVLAAWRRRRRQESVVDRWQYQVSWLPVTGLGDGAMPGGRWLLVVPGALAEGGLAVGCASVLAGGGAQVVTVLVSMADLDREVLAGTLRAVAGDDCANVVSLLALDEAELAVCQGVPAGVAGSLVLVQALGDAGITARLWVVTSGGVSAGDAGPVSVPQAMVWGLGRVAALEYPGRWGGLVDVPEKVTGRVAGWVRAVLAGETGEDQVAVREAGVLGRRLVHAPASPAAGSWRPSGAVLVTGGTGALGSRVARWLAGHGASRVVLASRRGIAAAGAAALAARVCSAGAVVTVAACDAGDRADLAGLWDRLSGAGVTVRGVVHAAGELDPGVIEGLTPARFAGVLRSKAAAAVYLDELTAGQELDAFVLFSSMAGTLGAVGEGNYAAANAALDAIAESRRARGLAGTSVGWGVWDGGGMAGEAITARAARGGVGLMAPGLATAVLSRVAAGYAPVVMVADVDWTRFAPAYAGSRPSPLLSGVPEARAAMEAAAPVEQVQGRGLLAGRLAGLGEGEQLELVLGVVCEQAAAVLGHASAGAVRAGAVFRDLGFDSLTAVEFRNRLGTVTGLSLPATLVFDYPTPRALARWMRAEITGILAAAVSAPSGTPAVVAGDAVAVVAMGCRFPGGVVTPEDLWELVRSGTDAMSGFPANRGWETAAGEFARVGGFVHDAGEFDAGFFGISPREALAMAPEQRLLLEVCWETIERAGVSPHSLRGSRTGVFAGTSGQDYATVLAAQNAEGYLTGTAASVVSGRVSYALGLEGPAVSVDTACSSALVALHLACQALRAGECDLALAGGVSVMATPGLFTEFAAQGGLASDGRCKSFGADADGTGWGEGAGVVLVERLSDARRLGHPVLAVIAGSAVNQDGASNGLTAPNGPSQQRVIRAALAAAGVAPGEVDAVEAHGTGTVLGDPIEAQALIAAYGPGRPEGRPLWLGSVK
ncbi:MAG TPA: SDR family NAD(P)-dependent oxidoreductase, partial [Streptosporangiaceae bacterium]|nr:SDR family NAD(P)-dependent oxidoreductase [Streptosporangiaceae bacterium]